MKESITATLQQKNNMWQAVISYKENGVWCRKWKSTKISCLNDRNKRKAKAALEEILSNFRQAADEEARLEGWGLETGVKDMLFTDLLQQWKRRKKFSVSQSTAQGYGMILSYALPYFSRLNVKVCDVTPAMLEAYYEMLLSKQPHPLSPNTVRKHATLFKSVFNDAVKDGYFTYNPAKRAKEPKWVPYNAETYSADEILNLLRAMKGHSLEDVVLIAVYYGLRRSEICGLRWQDVDFEQNKLLVRHKIIQAKVDGRHVIEKSNALKTQSSRRAFPLVPIVKERLLARKAWIERNKALCGNCYNNENDAYIFVCEDGQLLTPDKVSNRFRAFVKYHSELKRIRFHDLRHSCATLLLKEGNSLRAIQEYLGHATIITTMRYAHVDAQGRAEALGTIENALAQNSLEGSI